MTEQKPDGWDEYRALRDLVIEGVALPEQCQRFESLVLASEEMRQDYAQHAYIVSAISEDVPETLVRIDGEQESDSGPKRSIGLTKWLVGLAASILLIFGFGFWWAPPRRVEIATLDWADECHWGDSTVPTSSGQILGPGRLRLISGIATVRFPLVNVSLEGPVDFELISPTRCRVHSGRILASVEKGGEGFVVQTPTATLVDRGTVFGVSVSPDNESRLQVLRGEVDVSHHASGQQMTLKSDEKVQIESQTLRLLSGLPEMGSIGEQESPVIRSVQVSTAIGRGADAYVAPEVHPPESSSETALLVKRPPHSGPGDWGRPWQRKAFLKFDLSSVDKGKVESASLQLHGVETNIGFTSLVSDARFSVYGVIDDRLDDWTRSDLTWENSPAQSGDGLDLDSNAVVYLGEFVVPQGRPVGRFEVSSSELGQFLHLQLTKDKEQLATLIIIGETIGQGAAYAHGFASKRHPSLPAPMLRMQVDAGHLENK